jgi:branched-chain amino acid transport system substrate-binding protein
MMRTKFAVIVGALGLTLAACGSSGSSSAGGGSGGGSGAKATASKSPIYILSIGDVSGPTKIYGSLHYAGVQAAAAHYNAQGGIDGHKIVIKHLDSGGTAATAVSLAVKELAANPSKYVMVDAGAEGTENAALIPIMAKYHQFAITLDDTGGCSKASNCPTEFVVKGDPGDPQVTVADWLKKKGIKKVGILEEAIGFTQGETPGVVTAVKKDGLTSTIVSFPATATDLTPEMSQLKSAGVQAVFAEALGPPAGYALAARAKLAWNVPIVFDVAASSLDLTKLAPVADDANAYLDVYGCQDPAQSWPGLKTMFSTMPSQYKTVAGLQACDIPANGWDEVVMLHNAVTQANSLSGPTLVKTMENLSSSGQSDPLYITSRVKKYTAADHQDVGETPKDFVVIPVGPVSGAQDHPNGLK